MAAVNYERAWLRLKAYLDSKPSHGTRDLMAEMGRLEVACEIPEAEEGFDPRPMPSSSRPALAAAPPADPLLLEDGRAATG